MKLSVLVKPNSRKNAVKARQDGSLVVCVSAPPIEGRANEKLIEVLAKHFGKRKMDVVIVSGARRKHKVIEVR